MNSVDLWGVLLHGGAPTGGFRCEMTDTRKLLVRREGSAAAGVRRALIERRILAGDLLDRDVEAIVNARPGF